MRTVTVRKSGGAYIVAIPAFAIKQQQLEAGAEFSFDMDDGKMVFTPVRNELTLAEVLAESPKARLKMTDEDKAWESSRAMGNEF
jgi:antitoxin ChpS